MSASPQGIFGATEANPPQASAPFSDSPPEASGAAEKQEQLHRILASNTLRGSPLLQRFLRFIVEKSVDGSPEDLSEYAIAIGVLGRKPDFDPSSDTSVRTQAYRLRTKLREYYATEGKQDPLLIEIPKGHYLPCFSIPSTGTVEPPSAGAASGVASDALFALYEPQRGRRASPAKVLAAAVALTAAAVVLYLAGFYVGARSAAHSVADPGGNVDETLRSFWKHPSSANGMVLAFTNPIFLETTTGDLLAYGGGAVAERGSLVGRDETRASVLDDELAGKTGPLYYEDGFTGTGEVLAVHSLTDLLRQLGINLVVQRSRVLSATDLRNHDVLFLGSPIGNAVLDQITLPRRFVFELPHSSPYLWQGGITDTQAGASRSYSVTRDPHNHVILADYALFDVFPSPTPDHRIILLAGLTTTGTQGAAAFATSSVGLQQIVDILAKNTPGRKSLPPYFECLLRVDAVGGLDALQASAVSCSTP